MPSRVRDLAQQLMASAKYVSIDEDRAKFVAEKLDITSLDLPKWDFAPFYPQSDDFEEMCQFYLIFNAINYCYFDQDREKFREGKYSGSVLAGLCLTENWDEIKNPYFLSKIDENFLLTELFPADIPISLVKERTKALREVGHFLNSNTDFTFENLFRKYYNSAYFVSQVLPTFLPTWRDPFFKRSQLFVGMVYGRFQDWEEIPIERKSIRDLTVFADYRVPQTLINMGIITIGNELSANYSSKTFIESGSRKELEIRAATIVGSDLLMDFLDQSSLEEINSLHIDFLLWSAARKKTEQSDLFVLDLPHHYTISTDY